MSLYKLRCIDIIERTIFNNGRFFFNYLEWNKKLYSTFNSSISWYTIIYQQRNFTNSLRLYLKTNISNKGFIWNPISKTFPLDNLIWFGIPELSIVSTMHWVDISNIRIVYTVDDDTPTYTLSTIWIIPFSFSSIGFSIP